MGPGVMRRSQHEPRGEWGGPNLGEFDSELASIVQFAAAHLPRVRGQPFQRVSIFICMKDVSSKCMQPSHRILQIDHCL